MPRPVNRNLTQRMRQTLYALKRQYGERIDVYKLISTETDVRTGVKTLVKDLYPIHYGIVMPARSNRSGAKNVSEIAANKEFVFGGTFDTSIRTFIIDRRDCPTLPLLNSDDWIVYSGNKYQINTVDSFEVNAGWVITAKQLVGEVPEQIYLTPADDLLCLTDTATTE